MMAKQFNFWVIFLEKEQKKVYQPDLIAPDYLISKRVVLRKKILVNKFPLSSRPRGFVGTNLIQEVVSCHRYFHFNRDDM
jgi:hypothetical protein